MWEEGGGGERTPESGMLSGLRLRRGLVLGRRDSAKTASKFLELASDAAQTADF